MGFTLVFVNGFDQEEVGEYIFFLNTHKHYSLRTKKDTYSVVDGHLLARVTLSDSALCRRCGWLSDNFVWREESDKTLIYNTLILMPFTPDKNCLKFLHAGYEIRRHGGLSVQFCSAWRKRRGFILQYIRVDTFHAGQKLAEISPRRLQNKPTWRAFCSLLSCV